METITEVEVKELSEETRLIIAEEKCFPQKSSERAPASKRNTRSCWRLQWRYSIQRLSHALITASSCHRNPQRCQNQFHAGTVLPGLQRKFAEANNMDDEGTNESNY
jgi:hypothetical protein